MLKDLPQITQESIESFADTELVETNPGLARAILVSAEVAAEHITEDTESKEAVEAECQVAILLVLRLINRALEAKDMEARLKIQG